MKKLLVSIFLLVFGLCLVGCEHSTYGYQFHFCVDGGNGTISIETSSSFNPDVKMCKDVEDMCNLDCTEVSYFVELNGGEKGSREITFIATPNTGYQVKEWLFNGKIIESNKTNSYTAIVTREEDYVGVIVVRFEEIICNHQWDEGREIEGGSGAYVMKYICELCGEFKEEIITIIHPEIKPFYSLQEAFNNQFLTHDQLEQISNIYNSINEKDLPKLDSSLEQKILEEFCLVNDIQFGLDIEIPGSIRFFGQYYTGWWEKTCYIVMVDNLVDYGEMIGEEVVDGIIFNYDTTQRILVWIDFN